MTKQNLGMVTAYAYAVVGGYEGTEAEFEALLGNIATDLAEIENLTVIANTLPPGSSATASYDHGVLTLGIPKGDKGDTGAGATVTAGTTATGNPGTNASVTNSGTTKDAVFNFTIPRGDTGNGIESIYLTGTSGAVKTYTILFTDGNTTTFDVTDGEVTNAQLTAAVTGLKEDLTSLIDTTDYFNSNELTSGYMKADGTIGSDPVITHTDYIPCAYGDYVYVAGSSANQIPTAVFFDENKQPLYGFFDSTGTVNTPVDFPVIGSKQVAFVVYNVRSSVYVPYAKQYLYIMHKGYYIKNSYELALANLDVTNKDVLRFSDYFDETELQNGYINHSGVFTPDSNLKCTDYIPCARGDYIWFRAGGGSSLATAVFFDENKNFLYYYLDSNGVVNTKGEFGVVGNPSVAYVRYNVRSAVYVPYGEQYFRIQTKGNIIRNIQDQDPVVYVSKTTTGNNYYSKITDAINYANANPNTTIYVEPGEYDIIEELGGSEYTESLSGYSTYSGGLMLGNNTSVIGIGSNVKLKAIYTVGTNQVMTDKFSIFNVYGSFKLENIEMEVENVRYCVHEDSLALPAQNRPLFYKGIYKNCKLKHNGTVSTTYTVSACIGGGTMNNSMHIIDECVLISPQNINPASYHNNETINNGTGHVIVKDCYFGNNGTFSVSIYNGSTQKIYAEVNGCRLGANIVNNTGGLHEVIEWNNTIAN